MSHFAKLNSENIVIEVTVGSQSDDGKEKELSERTGDTYKQTSYNTRGGVHYDPVTNQPSLDQSKAFRKNYAGIGYIYDYELNAFYSPQPYPSWSLNKQSCLWESPIPMPQDGLAYEWDEENQTWVLIK